MLNRLAALATRYALTVLMAALILFAALYALDSVLYQPGFSIGDWLINYSQGFLRRGLFGQIILLSGHALHIPLPWMTVLVQFPIYLATLVGVYKLAAPLRRDVLWFCMLFCPAALAFMILDFLNGFRKEILLFAALTAAIFLLRKGVSDIWLAVSLMALFTVLLLSHESEIFCFPYFFAAIAISTGDLKRAVKICVAPFLLAAALFVFVGHHPGTVADSIGICRSVGGTWKGMGGPRGLCTGAIAWLGMSFAQYHAQELQYLRYWPMYTVDAVLSFAPFVVAMMVLYRREKMRFEVRVLAPVALLCFAASFGLFYATIDWGRWIHMQIVCLLLVILFTAQRAKGFQKNSDTPSPIPAAWRKPVAVAAFLYCTCWTLPVVADMPVRYGYADLALHIHREIRLQRMINSGQIPAE